MLTLHNFANRPTTVTADPKWQGGTMRTDVFDEHHSRSENGTHGLKLSAYGHRWMRDGASDNALNRSPF